jgi:hypothetical protein
LTNAEEKRVIADIGTLKKSIPIAEKIINLRPEKDGLKEKKTEIREELDLL